MSSFWIFLVIFLIFSFLGSGSTFYRKKSNSSKRKTGDFGNNPSNAFEANKRIWQHNVNKTVNIPYYQYIEFYNEFPFLSYYEETVKYLQKKNISQTEINKLVDKLNHYESQILNHWEKEQHKLLMAFDRTMLGTSPQMINFLLGYYNAWLSTLRELMIDYFIKFIVPGEIGILLNHDPKTVLNTDSFTKTINYAFNQILMKLSTATDVLIQQLNQEVQFGRMFNNQQQFEQFRQSQQQNQRQNQSQYIEDFDEIVLAYKTLNVNENCSDEELKQSYRKLAMKFHPDKNPNIKAKEQMSKINAAYDLIKKIRNIK